MGEAVERMEAEEIGDATTVMIVDDSRIARMKAKKALVDAGVTARIVEADCADAALEIWASETPDFAIVDLNMPGEDGLSMCASIRETQPDARLILCTANLQQAVSKRAETLNVPMLNKPLTVEKLKPAIAPWLDG